MYHQSIEGFRISPQQKHLWLLQELASSQPFRNQCAILIEGNVNIVILELALKNVINKYEILRTTFHLLPGMTIPVQVIAEQNISTFFHHDFSGLKAEVQNANLESLFQDAIQRVIDIEHGPVLDISLVTLSINKHILLVGLPALCSDTVTLKNLVREISIYYAACLDNKELSDEPLQYADIAEWQNELFESEDAEIGKNYWKKQNFSSLSTGQINFEKKSTVESGFKPELFTFKINFDTVAKLEALAHKYETSTSVVLLACWQILLWRLSGKSDVVVGTFCDGRNHQELESALGLFAKYLPVFSHLEDNFLLSQVLNQTSNSIRDSLNWQEYLNWEQIVESTENPLNSSFLPFCFEFEEQLAKYSAADVLFSIYKQYVCIEKFKVKLSCVRRDDSLIAEFHYDSNLFRLEDIERLVGQYQTLLESVIDKPEATVSQLEILDARSRQQLLVEFNQTQVDYPLDKCIHKLFEEQVERTPNSIAVVYEEEQLTYRELNARANKVARQLQQLGVTHETIVGLYVERSVSALIGLLGILKAGGAYLPLDPQLPTERLNMMLQDAGVGVILTQQHLASSVSGCASVVCLDGDWEAIAQQPEENLPSSTTVENLVYVIYTSGSTGTPKGVSISHRQLLNYVESIVEKLDLTPGCSFATVSTLAADLGNTMIFPSLLTGGCLHVISLERVTNPLAWADYCTHHGIDCLKIVPSHLNALLSAAQPEKILPLKRLILGGEACSWQLVAKIQDLAPKCQIFNHYGPTETTVGVLTYQVESAVDCQTVPLGRPLGNTQIYLLDRHLQPVAIGVPGELYIGGDGLARGYLHSPQQTAANFIPHPWSESQGARLYRTGDKARYLPDGHIEYLGRIDNQIKLRGFRIELGEIEAILAQHPALVQNVVIATLDPSGERRLVAFCVAKQQKAPTSSDLRDFLKPKLPEYMLPSAFVILDALPLTANGKVDRSALEVIQTTRMEDDITFVAPRTPTEEILAAIWAQVLAVEQVGIYNNFFELGGDSILSIQIVAKAYQAGIQITPKQLFEHQTIAKLAAVVGTTQAVEMEQGMVTGSLPLIPIQHWFFEKNLPQPQHWNQAVLLQVPPDIDPVKLEQVVQQLLVHHDALRLRFLTNENGWEQTNAAPDDTIPFSVFDLSALPQTQQKSAIESTATEIQASLNLSNGPLMRVALLTLGAGMSSRLLIVIHHLVVDGVSWRILLSDLHTGYQQLALGENIQLPPKTTSFKDWAERLTEYARSLTEQQLTYWLASSQRLVSRLPIDFVEGTNTEASAHTASVSLSVDETRALLQEVPKAYNTQINDILLTALLQAYCQWSGSNSVLLNLEGHGREEILAGVDLSRTVGWLTSVFPVLLELATTDNLGDILRSVKEQLRAIPNKGIDYGLLWYSSGDRAKASALQKLPPAEICFNYLGQFNQLLSAASIFKPAAESFGKSRSSQGRRSYLLDVNAHILGGQLQINWTYSTNLHQHSTIENLAQQFVTALHELIAHCLSPFAGGYSPSDFPLAALSFDELERGLASLELEAISQTNRKNIEDIYPLSPVQQGMLFHTLYDSKSGVYFDQLSCTLEGNLQLQAFQEAWEQVLAEYQVLRTAFIWQGQSQPLQTVYRQVQLPLEIYDWRGVSRENQQQQLSAFFQSDRERGFKLSQVPLMRLTIIQMDDYVYEFVWSRHHLLIDGWSVSKVLHDVLVCYEARTKGQDIHLESPALYRDYIAWLQKQNKADAEQFWRSVLQGFTAPTPLVVDKSTTNLLCSTELLGEQQIQLSSEATKSLVSFARQHQLTLNTLVQGAWALLLSRYSGETDVIFGVTVSGRSGIIKGVESIVGLLINTLPLRVSVHTDESIVSWLKKIHNQQVEMSQYEYSSLVQVQGWSEVPRGLPLFESIVVFENYPVDEVLRERKFDLHLREVRTFEKTNYALSLVAVPDHQFSLQLEYDTHRFDAATIARMLGHLKTLLEGIVVYPHQRLSSLPILSTAEQQLLVEWNDTKADFPKDLCIHQMFEAQVERTPDAVAVVFADQILTYRELNNRANKLAHYLQKLGVGPEVLVGICVERSLLMVVGLLGILKAGGAYMPLDPAYPQERLAFMLADSQVPVLLTQENLVVKLPELTAHVVCLDTSWSIISHESQYNTVSRLKIENLAYVIYTSGSTGIPKGVAIAHRSLVNTYLAWEDSYQLRAIASSHLQMASIAFDVFSGDLVRALCSGGKLVLCPREWLLAPEKLYGLIREQDIDCAEFVPAVLSNLISYLKKTDRCLNFMRLLVVGSDSWHVKEYEEFQHFCGQQTRLINSYGVTEATIDSCYFENTEVKLPVDRLVPIGRPITNIQLYLLDKHFQPVPIGVPGELYISGDGLARGYLNRPDLTAEKFIPNPFSNESSARLYKTGDIACYLSDGNIEYLARTDHQVKIRGFRIELGEIEAVIGQHSNIHQTVAIVREDVPGDKRLVAYLVAKQQPVPTVGELRRFLKKQLPEYMIPSAFVTLDTLPLSANGKVDRRALPVPQIAHIGDQITFVAPRTPIEEILAEIWAEVLGIEVVGVHDNFFTLGGHSLLATQLISQVRTKLAVEIPLRSLFDNPTVSEFAQCIAAFQESPSITAPPLLATARNENLPLSFAQQRLWFLDQLELDGSLYNISSAVRIEGKLNVIALEDSFNQVISRHEVLRTNFVVRNDQPVQVIVQTSITLPVIDLQELPQAEQETYRLRLAKQEAVSPFDLTTAPLVRAKLLKLGETEHILLLSMHHIVADGWSMDVLVRELLAIYQGFYNDLPKLPIQYADFAVWQRQWLKGEVLENQLAYWKRQLGSNLPVLKLPTTRPRTEVKTNRGATNSFIIPSNLSKAIKVLSRQESVTLFMTLLASFQVLLQRYTNQDDIIIGTDVANRNRSEIEPLIGFFVNLLVLRTDLSGNPSFRELLKRVREVTLGAYAHQDLPFEKLVETLRPERSFSSTSPLFQVLFVLQNTPMPVVELPGLTISNLEVDTEVAKFELALFLTETEQGILGNWRYNADLFENNTINRMSEHFQTLLNSIVARPDSNINRLEMLNQSEKEQQAAKKMQQQASKFKKFMAVQPKAMDLSQERLIKTDFLLSGEKLPLVITPNVDDIDIFDWANNNRGFIETKLLEHGGILFRNFNIAEPTEFESLAEAIYPELFGEYGDLPREGVSGKVYGSTPYPSDQTILFHHESSHLHCWPQKIWFFCVQPAQQGGETPIVDSRKVLQLLNPKLREKLEQKQLMYVRNYTKGLDVSWQDFFHTTDKAEVEEYCGKASIRVEWKSDGDLRTSQVRPAVIKHPKTGEAVFFNQILLHHTFCLKSEVRESLFSDFEENNLPRNVYYGDGSPIEDSVIEEILAVYQQAEVSFPWQKGDVLMLDNMLAAHKRNPYVGSRKIVVAMGQMIHSTDI